MAGEPTPFTSLDFDRDMCVILAQFCERMVNTYRENGDDPMYNVVAVMRHYRDHFNAKVDA